MENFQRFYLNGDLKLLNFMQIFWSLPLFFQGEVCVFVGVLFVLKIQQGANICAAIVFSILMRSVKKSQTKEIIFLINGW